MHNVSTSLICRPINGPKKHPNGNAPMPTIACGVEHEQAARHLVPGEHRFERRAVAHVPPCGVGDLEQRFLVWPRDLLLHFIDARGVVALAQQAKESNQVGWKVHVPRKAISAGIDHIAAVDGSRAVRAAASARIGLKQTN